MNTLDATGSVLDEDGKGGYRFDRLALPGPFDILGFFLGEMSRPIIAESQEEREARHSHVVMLPEEADTVGIALEKQERMAGTKGGQPFSSFVRKTSHMK